MVLEIIHLKQVHGLPKKDSSNEELIKLIEALNNSQNTTEKLVVKSQYEIANYLLLNSNLPIVMESITENIVSLTLNNQKIPVFPNGFPISFKQLTLAQKVCLYKFGAALTLVNYSLLPIIYKSINPDDDRNVRAEQSKLSTHEINQRYRTEEDAFNRENFALDNVEIAAQTHYGSSTEGKVILIFGTNHDFKKECSERGHKLTEIWLDAAKEYAEIHQQDLKTLQENERATNELLSILNNPADYDL